MSDTTIKGEFDISIEPLSKDRQTLIDVLSRANSGRHNPIATVHREAVQALARLYVPHISVSPSADQFRDVADFLRHWAAISDRVLKIVGQEAASNTSETIGMSDFTDSFVGAIEGNATFQLERCAQAVEAEEEAAEHYADDGWIDDNGQFGVGA
jgi:hypothetical protein